MKEYLKQTRERAKDALAESIYWFVKSHQYENLQDVDDTFYNFDSSNRRDSCKIKSWQS